MEIQEKIPYVLRIDRAKDYQTIVEGRAQTEYTSVDIPDLAVGFGDDQEAKHYHTGCTSMGVVQLENGDIIVSMYGQFKSDQIQA